MPVGFNKRRVGIKTPAGNKATGTTSTGSRSGIEKVQAHVSWGCNGSSSPTAASIYGDPASVVRSGVGVFVVTLGGLTDLLGKYGVRRLLTAVPYIQKSARSVLDVEIGAINESAGTVEVVVVNRSTGAAADPVSAGANERIGVVITFDNGAI